MFKAKFPVYALRAYESISYEGDLVLIHTHYTDYILDDRSIEGNYFDRRLAMRVRKYDHKVYPLRERFTMLSQLANTKRRDFIDEDGKLWKYRPTKFYRIEYAKVHNVTRTWKGHFLLHTRLPVNFIADQVYAYVGYIKVGKSYFLYDLTDERGQSTRKKL